MNGAMAERIVFELEPQRHEHSLMSDGAKSEQRGAASGKIGNLRSKIPIALPYLVRFGLVSWRQAFNRVGDAAIHELQVVVCGSGALMSRKPEFI